MQERNPGTEIMPAQPFDAIRKTDAHGEHWSARDLQPMLGYSKWQDFTNAIDRAKITCTNSGNAVTSHFMDSHKINGNGPASKDYRLSRYACYLIGMNGDPRKPEIARAQTYFAVKTREAEVASVPRPTGELVDLDVLRAAIDHIAAARREALAAREAADEAREIARGSEARLDAIEGRHDWFAGLAYAKLNQLPTSAVYLQRLGKAAGKVGRAHGITPNKVQHALYGEVNQWPVWVWELAVEERRAS